MTYNIGLKLIHNNALDEALGCVSDAAEGRKSIC